METVIKCDSTDPFNQAFAEQISKLCLKHFKYRLAAAGKLPNEKKPSHMAAFVLSIYTGTDETYKLRVVSMATGSKCIGKNAMCSRGSAVHDSHAEVLSRRALLRYLNFQLNFVSETSKASEVFEIVEENSTVKLKSGVDFHLFTTCIPCGDAAIFPKTISTNENEELPPSKRFQVDDIHRTGAKCCENGPQDSRSPGEDYHVVGALRTKPGRGDPTLSMSCSDKIARWNVLGLQGAFLSIFIAEPIYLKTITVASDRCDLESLQRGVIDRIMAMKSDLPNGYSLPTHIRLFKSALGSEESEKVGPNALVWCDVISRPLEIIVNGYKQGATAKSIKNNSSKIRCAVSRYELFLEFCGVAKKFNNNLNAITILTGKMNYGECKLLAVNYQEAKRILKSSLFSTWTKKPENLQQFHLSSTDLDMVLSSNDSSRISQHSSGKRTFSPIDMFDVAGFLEHLQVYAVSGNKTLVGLLHIFQIHSQLRSHQPN